MDRLKELKKGAAALDDVAIDINDSDKGTIIFRTISLHNTILILLIMYTLLSSTNYSNFMFSLIHCSSL